ncbi:MAG: hypothetical protein BGO67_11470 [Alphaproteobacteria bacterium 41-28]|nr:MAG: hypothetical protein BGO67_11470 [Alphaproteobacteria bacterium 41-28]
MKARSIITLGTALTSIALFSIPVEAMQELETPVRKTPPQRRAPTNTIRDLNYDRGYFAENGYAKKKLDKFGHEVVRDRDFVAHGYKEPKTPYEWFRAWFGL